MLENPKPTMGDSSYAAKRYTPPNQRNRSLNRRKSGDRLDRNNSSFGNDGDKSHFSTSRNVPTAHGDVGMGVVPDPSPRLIALEGCSRSEAFQHMSSRWAAALDLYNDPTIDLSERPVMYSGSNASAWGQLRLPHQIMAANNAASQMDFLGELRQAMRNAKAGSNN